MSHKAAVTVEPAALYFPAPHDRPVQNVVKVKNSGSESFAVKVKAVAPSRYFVKPKRFLINPGQTTQVTISMPKPEVPVTNGKRDLFQFECRTVPPGKVGRFEDMWDTLGEATTHINLIADPTPSPPASANIVYVSDTAGLMSEASTAASPAPSAVTSARLTEAQTERKEALRRTMVAQQELSAQKDVETSLESQRDELIAESKDGSALPSVRLSVAMFAMLSCYIAGMLLARGWPRVPA